MEVGAVIATTMYVLGGLGSVVIIARSGWLESDRAAAIVALWPLVWTIAGVVGVLWLAVSIGEGEKK